MERLVERKKASNEQLEMMLQLLSENEHLAKGRILGKKGHAKAWVQIANALNSYEFGAVKTPEKWLQTWRDLRCNTKKRAAKIARGLGERNSLSEFELRVLNLVGVSPVIALDIPESTISSEESSKIWTNIQNNDQSILENSHMDINNSHMSSVNNMNSMNASNINGAMSNGVLNTNNMNSDKMSSHLLNGSDNNLSSMDACAGNQGLDNMAKKRKIQKMHNDKLVKMAAQTIRSLGKWSDERRPDTMILNTLSASTKRIISVGRFGGKVRTTGLEQEIMSLEQEKIDLQRQQFEELKKYHAARLQAEQEKISLLQGILVTLRQSKSKPNSNPEENTEGEASMLEVDIASVMKNILTKTDDD